MFIFLISDPYKTAMGLKKDITLKEKQKIVKLIFEIMKIKNIGKNQKECVQEKTK